MENSALTPRIVESNDGSHTLRIDGLNEHYHSHKGAVQESNHVFLKMGLELFSNQAAINLLEVGFGTGLNALLTALSSAACNIHYTALEPFPLDWDLLTQLNYPEILPHPSSKEVFLALHQAPWEGSMTITPKLTIFKSRSPLQSFQPTHGFDLVYYDAFAPHAQPDLWTTEIWVKVYHLMNQNAVLVTYCAKGQVRRDMQSAGFKVERLQGPPGKREMIRATK